MSGVETYTLECDGCSQIGLAVASSREDAVEWLYWQSYDLGGVVLCLDCEYEARDNEDYYYLEEDCE